MPTEDRKRNIRFEFGEDGEPIQLEFSGPITAEDAVGALGQLLVDPRFQRGADALIDISGAELDTSAADIRRVRDQIEPHQDERGDCRLAVVAPTDINYGLVRMFEAWSSDLKMRTRAFRTREEAVAWLAEEPVEE
jgi:hypothetical protein